MLKMNFVGLKYVDESGDLCMTLFKKDKIVGTIVLKKGKKR